MGAVGWGGWVGGGGRKGEVCVVWASEGVVVSQFMFDKEPIFLGGRGLL